MDSSAFIVSAIGAIITSALSYYSFRTIRQFKSSVAARAWVYISIGGILFCLGAVTFLIVDLASPSAAFVGVLLDTLGGLFFLLGLRKNFLFWSSQDHFM